MLCWAQAAVLPIVGLLGSASPGTPVMPLLVSHGQVLWGPCRDASRSPALPDMPLPVRPRIAFASLTTTCLWCGGSQRWTSTLSWLLGPFSSPCHLLSVTVSQCLISYVALRSLSCPGPHAQPPPSPGEHFEPGLAVTWGLPPTPTAPHELLCPTSPSLVPSSCQRGPSPVLAGYRNSGEVLSYHRGQVNPKVCSQLPVPFITGLRHPLQ